MTRIGEVSRKTGETDIHVKVNLDGKGIADANTGVKFLDHMLNSLATHSLIVPMDCSLAFAAVDLSKRPYVKVDLKLRGKKIEDMPCEDIIHFIKSLATALRANVHVWVQYGSNDHHKVEAAFKALALSLRQAVSIDPRRSGIPSSKGVI